MSEASVWPGGLAVGATRIGRRCNRYEESVIFYRDVVGLPLVHAAETDGSLSRPIEEAIALVFLFTAFATWNSLVDENGLSHDVARALTREICLDAGSSRDRVCERTVACRG